MRHSGVLLVMTAAMFWGFSGAIANLLLDKGWDPLVISFYRGAVGLLFFRSWALRPSWFKKRRSGRFYLWSFLAGAGVAGNFTFYFYSIEAASISVAATLMYSAPVFVLLTSLVVGIERPSLGKWMSVGIVLFGITLLSESYDPAVLQTSFKGTLYGLASGISYAVFIFGFKKASLMARTPPILSVSFLVFSILLFLLMDTQEATDVFFSNDLWWFLLLGILGAGLSFILYVIGLRTTPPSTASIVALIEPVTASVAGILFLNDALSLIQGLGMVLILVTIGLLNSKDPNPTMHRLKKHRKKARREDPVG